MWTAIFICTSCIIGAKLLIISYMGDRKKANKKRMYSVEEMERYADMRIAEYIRNNK